MEKLRKSWKQFNKLNSHTYPHFSIFEMLITRAQKIAKAPRIHHTFLRSNIIKEILNNILT